MKLRTIHAEVTVNPDLHPTPLVFTAVGGGFYEGEVPDAVGGLLLRIGRPGEYEVLDAPKADVSAKADKPLADESQADEGAKADAGKAKGKK